MKKRKQFKNKISIMINWMFLLAVFHIVQYFPHYCLLIFTLYNRYDLDDYCLVFILFYTYNRANLIFKSPLYTSIVLRTLLVPHST